MNLLLDTHALLWWLADIELGDDARAAIADPDNLVAVSAASVWEIAIKRALGKLDAPAAVAPAVTASGFDHLDITAEHAEAASALPTLHRDPFDRMLVAEARAEELRLVTRNSVFERYGVPTLGC